VEEDGVDEETSLQLKKVLQNWLPSYARRHRTLGTTWPMTRSTEEGAHRRPVEVGDGIRCRGRNGEARATKPSGKHRDPLVKLRAKGIKEWVAEQSGARWRGSEREWKEEERSSCSST
jgi:hypothetical protein